MTQKSSKLTSIKLNLYSLIDHILNESIEISGLFRVPSNKTYEMKNFEYTFDAPCHVFWTCSDLRKQ